MNNKEMLEPFINESVFSDEAICEDCLLELFDRNNRRYLYPYTSCPSCGPKYTMLETLPFKRQHTAMKHWEMCAACRKEYEDPNDRRYQSEMNSCPNCGPDYRLYHLGNVYDGEMMFQIAVGLLHSGEMIAVKSNGGYHLVCDATNIDAIKRLRKKIHRERKPFAMMAKDMEAVERIAHVSDKERKLLTSQRRPIVLLASKGVLPDVIAPNNKDLGIMLPYTALHHILFHFGAPEYLIMTSANYPGEPTIHQEEDIFRFAEAIDCACLVGERPIERSVDDSVVKQTKRGMLPIRRSRGFQTVFPIALATKRPILAVGADLKNTITLIKDDKVIMSHHLGDMTKYAAQLKFEKTLESYLRMFNISLKDTVIAHDLHPSYFTTQYAEEMNGYKHVAIQHHEAHLASVLAMKGEFERPVIGIIFDGTGYGTDGEIWGGEMFVGSLSRGFERVGHLRKAVLVGGDAAATMPVQALAGFVDDKDDIKMLEEKLRLPPHFTNARKIKAKNIHCFPTTSVGRLFDAAAAILGFHHDISFEGEAAIWLEHIATKGEWEEVYRFPWTGKELDYRPLLHDMILAKVKGNSPSSIARAFHRGLAQGVSNAIRSLSRQYEIDRVVLSGGVFQNSLLLADLSEMMEAAGIEMLFDSQTPVNDNGISLGQAAIAAMKCLKD